MNENEAAASPSPRSPQTPPLNPKRLYRDPKGYVAGVASGLAAYFDIDPVITRLLFVAALLSGVGFPAYIIFWIVVPKAPSWPPPGYGSSAARDTGAGPERRGLGDVTSGVLIVVLAALLGLGFTDAGDHLLPAALLGFGVYLLLQRPSGGASSASEAPNNSVNEVAAPGATPAQEEPAKSLVTPTVLSLLAIGLGLALALRSAGLVELSVAALASGGLLIVAAGLVASLWLGRARALIPVGLLLSLILLGASVAGPVMDRARGFTGSFDGGEGGQTIGQLRHTPLSLSELQPSYRLGLGSMKLDLRELDLQGETREMDIEIGMGELRLKLPEDISTVVRGSVDLGELRAPHQRGGHIDVTRDGDSAGKLIINFHIGMGEGRVSYDD